MVCIYKVLKNVTESTLRLNKQLFIGKKTENASECILGLHFIIILAMLWQSHVVNAGNSGLFSHLTLKSKCLEAVPHHVHTWWSKANRNSKYVQFRHFPYETKRLFLHLTFLHWFHYIYDEIVWTFKKRHGIYLRDTVKNAVIHSKKTI